MGKSRPVVMSLSLPLAIAAAPAFADDGNWRVGNDQVHIVDHAIDVATPGGRELLLKHVERAAEVLCRDRVGGFRERCEAETVRETAHRTGAWGKALTIALQERDVGFLAAK